MDSFGAESMFTSFNIGIATKLFINEVIMYTIILYAQIVVQRESFTGNIRNLCNVRSTCNASRREAKLKWNDCSIIEIIKLNKVIVQSIV